MRPVGIFKYLFAGAITEDDRRVTPVDEKATREVAFPFGTLALWRFGTSFSEFLPVVFHERSEVMTEQVSALMLSRHQSPNY